MNNEHVRIWGRDLDLKVVFDCYEGEDILATQRYALDTLLSAWPIVSRSLNDIKRYCLEKHREDVPDGRIDNVFKYVMPESLFVPRDQRKRTVALMCDFRPDLEHGLALVFENEKLIKIGPQDIAL